MIINFGPHSIDCFEAHSPDEQRVGLSELDQLLDGQGMVFVYHNESTRSFWMPASMAFAIDIVFVGANRKVQRIHTNCLPGSKLRFSGAAQWVVELPANSCRKLGIHVGQPVGIDGEVTMEEAVVGAQGSDRLRGLTTAELYAMKEGQSTETQPYQRAPSVAPSNPSERFRDHQMPADYVPDAGTSFNFGPVRDESINSPTRPA